MPALPSLWMDKSRWQQESFHWATYAYHLLAPRVNVQGRMALLLLVAVIWAFAWHVSFYTPLSLSLLLTLLPQASLARLLRHPNPQQHLD